jgi:hypothetical protein
LVRSRHTNVGDTLAHDYRIACGKPHFAFFLLGILAVGLFLGATVSELLLIHRAKQRWSDEVAAEVGMRFDIGVLTYREFKPWLYSFVRPYQIELMISDCRLTYNHDSQPFYRLYPFHILPIPPSTERR